MKNNTKKYELWNLSSEDNNCKNIIAINDGINNKCIIPNFEQYI